MLGAPPIHLIALAIVFAALAVPLVQLTGTRHSPPGQLPADSSNEMHEMSGPTLTVGAFLTVRFAHRPSHLNISVQGKPLLQVALPVESPLQADVSLPAFDDRLELAVQVEWPPGTPDTAVTLDVEPDGREGRSLTLWSHASDLDTVVDFVWP